MGVPIRIMRAFGEHSPRIRGFCLFADCLALARAGVPHIVLPVWYDTYDFASRVEYLGIGIYGSKSCSPKVKAEEFGNALMRVVGHESQRFREKARKLQGVCQERGFGRVVGAKKVLGLAQL